MKNNSPTSGDTQSLPLAAPLLGGLDNVRRSLINALAKAREDASMTCDDVDSFCKLGVEGAPGICDIEENPALLTSRIFSVVSSLFPFVHVDSIFNDEIKYLQREKKEELLDFGRAMAGSSLKPVAALGEEGVESVSAEDSAPLMLVLRAIRELDKVAEEVA